MTDFETKVKEINVLLEKGDKMSIMKAEKEAEKLKMEVQASECLEKDMRMAKTEIILGMCQAFLGKFDAAMNNLESALRKHLSFDVLNLDYWNKAYKMFNICKGRINILPDARRMILSFNEFGKIVATEFGE